MAIYTFNCAEPECQKKVVYRYEPIDVTVKMLRALSGSAVQPPVLSAYLTCANGHVHEYHLAGAEGA
jgi:hypothetical protein